MPRRSTGGKPPRKALSGKGHAPLGSMMATGGSSFDEADTGVTAEPSMSAKGKATGSAAPKPEKRHKGARKKMSPRRSTGGKAPRKVLSGKGPGL